MKFREEIYSENGKIIKKFYIDDKEVTHDVYLKLTDELYENIKVKQDEHPDEVCACEECQYLNQLVNEIKQSSDSEAVEILRNEIEFRTQEAYLQAQHVLANELGNSLIKYAVRLEDDLEDLYESNNWIEVDEDDK